MHLHPDEHLPNRVVSLLLPDKYFLDDQVIIKVGTIIPDTCLFNTHNWLTMSCQADTFASPERRIEA
jgi:hypothetical protein